MVQFVRWGAGIYRGCGIGHRRGVQRIRRTKAARIALVYTAQEVRELLTLLLEGEATHDRSNRVWVSGTFAGEPGQADAANSGNVDSRVEATDLGKGGEDANRIFRRCQLTVSATSTLRKSM